MNESQLKEIILKKIKLVIDNNDYSKLKECFNADEYQDFIQIENNRIFKAIQNIMDDYL